MATDNRRSEPSLPTARRGYDRDATDKILAELHATAGRLIGERDDARAERDKVQAECERAQAELAEARSLAAELEEKLDDGRERQKEITDALVVASRVRAESEREGEELKAESKREAEAMTAEAKRKADEIVRAVEAITAEAEEKADEIVRAAEAVTAEAERKADEIVGVAEAEAEKILDDTRSKMRGFDREIRHAERLATQVRAQLTAFLESLLAEIEPHGADFDSTVDELLDRAAQAAKTDRGMGHGGQPDVSPEGSRKAGRGHKMAEPQPDGSD